MDTSPNSRSLQSDDIAVPWYQRISLRYHIIGHCLLSVALVCGMIFAILYFFIYENESRERMKRFDHATAIISNMVRQTANLSLRSHLQSLADANLALLGNLHEDVLLGKLSDETAKERARHELPALTRQITGEAYVLTLSGGEQISSNDTSETQKSLGFGLHIVNPRVHDKIGEVPGEETSVQDYPRLRAIFKTYFAPWNWNLYLSTSLDTSVLLNQNIKDLLASFYFSANEYVCIINAQGDILYHPWLQGTVRDIENPTMRASYDRIITMKTGSISSAWQDPNEGKAEKKALFFHFIPELDWIVVSSIQEKELSEQLMGFGLPAAFIIIMTLSVTLLLSFYLANALVRPLVRLSKQMNTVDEKNGNTNVRADENGLGEVALFGRHFNRYMENFYQVSDSLNREIKDREVSEQQFFIYYKAFESALEGVCITDQDANILNVNRAFVEITGYTKAELKGRNMNILKSGRHEKEMYAEMWQSLRDTGHWSGEIWNKRKNGEIYPEMLNISAIYDDEKKITHFVGVFRDITEIKYQEERISHQAYHDPLTGLPNRALAIDRIGVSIAHVKRGGTKLAVLFLDLDNFKTVNDTLGHDAGDKLLIEVSTRMKAQVREEDTVARLGGDEFLVLVAAILSEDMVIDIARRILRAFSSPFFINGHELFVTVSVGISFYPQDGDTPNLLIKHADVAMYQAKSRGKNNYHLFTADLSERVAMFRESENNFRRALVAKEFELYYQPKFDLLSNRISGAEALVRWRKPDGTVVGPLEFMTLAEQSGLILPLGEQIFNSTCQLLHQLRDEGYDDLIISVNLSPLQFGNIGLVEGVLTTLRKHNIPGSCLELELTESAMLGNPEKSASALNQLVESGISITLDDFGTGYSSLAYLKKLPISTLKIDNSFICGIPDDFDSCQLVKTIIMMANNLDIGMIAEGVETQEQVDWLRANNCEQAQGYFFSRPLSEENFLHYLRKQQTRH